MVDSSGPNPGRPRHPISVIVLSATAFDASREFYRRLFGWPMRRLSDRVAVTFMQAGPAVVLRRYDDSDEVDAPPAVPLLQVPHVDEALAAVLAAGGRAIGAPYQVPLGGRVIRFADPSGTVYGLTSHVPPGSVPQVPMPLGANPRPVEGTVCNMEMYAADLEATGRFFDATFAWQAMPTLPSYAAFEPGAGISGVWQSHTPSTPALPYIYVADVAQTLVQVAVAGGTPRGAPTAVPGMATFGYFTDPSGTAMGVMGR